MPDNRLLVSGCAIISTTHTMANTSHRSAGWRVVPRRPPRSNHQSTNAARLMAYAPTRIGRRYAWLPGRNSSAGSSVWLIANHSAKPRGIAVSRSSGGSIGSGSGGGSGGCAHGASAGSACQSTVVR